MYLMVRMVCTLLSGEGDQPLEPGSPQNPGGLLRQAGDLDGSVQLPHPLPQTEEDGDAGTVHKGDAGAVHNELAGEHLVNGLVQVLENPLDPVVVNLPRQGDGEDAVVGGIGDSHGKNPFLWWVVKTKKRRVPRWVHGDYTAFLGKRLSNRRRYLLSNVVRSESEICA